MPFPNEHSLRLRDPGDFAPDSFRRTKGSGKGRVQGVTIPSTISVIWGKLKGAAEASDPPIGQALRFPKDAWTEAKAKDWIRSHKLKGTFEAAANPKSKSSAEVVEYRKVHKSDLVFTDPKCRVEIFEEGQDAEGNPLRRFRMLVNNGRPMRSVFMGQIIVDLASLQIPENHKLPALFAHQDESLDSIVGFTDKVETSPVLAAEGVFSNVTESADKVKRLADEGYPFECSMYVPGGRFEEVQAGTEVEVNGETFEGPISVIRGAELREVTWCVLGRDRNTSGIAAGQEEEIEIAVVRHTEDKSMDLETLKAEHADIVEALKAEFAAEQSEPDHAQAIEEALKTERERVDAILADGAELGVLADAVKLVKDGASFSDAQVKLRDARLAAQRNDSSPSVGGGSEGDTAPVSFEDKCRGEWDANPSLHAEFTDYKFFESYKRLEKQGRLPKRVSA